MKKQLLALAVAGAFVAPAVAQNVTMSGTFDAGISMKDTRGAKSYSSANDDNLGSSVLNFNISEDLGNGLKASVVMTTALKPGNGGNDEIGAAATTDILFDEASFIKLQKGDNSFAFGRHSTAIDNHKSYANMGANLFTDTDGSLNFNSRPAAGTTSLETKVAGVGIQATYTDGSDVIESTANSIASYALTYSVQGVDLAYAYAKNNDGISESTLNAGTKVGPVDLKAQFMTHKRANETSKDARLTKLGAKYTTGAIDVLYVFQKLSTEVSNADETANGAMLVYNMSKRTAAYAGYNKRSGSAGNVDIQETTFGVQHKF